MKDITQKKAERTKIMVYINKNYTNLTENYLFSEIARKISEYSARNPGTDIIKMGIGDVTLPLCDEAIRAMTRAVSEMGKAETFHGYGPEQGYDFLRQKIQSYYADRKIQLDEDEIFVSDGAKCCSGNILHIFGKENRVLIPDPVYPVYVDTNIMDGRSISFADADRENNFLPMPNENTHAELIYICSPNNPTGAVYSRSQLKSWVDFALQNGSVILFDAAYESFVSSPDLPRSIYEIEGAKYCAVEFCSLSKTAGFTGTRCGYTIVPKSLVFDKYRLNKLWLRRQTTKFNGVSYIVQRGAEAVFGETGQKQIKANIDYYRENAKLITSALDKLGIYYTGGKNSPYIWMECPDGMNSWQFFDCLLSGANVVGTPGSGFGKNGEGFFRLTAFSTNEKTAEAMERLSRLLA